MADNDLWRFIDSFRILWAFWRSLQKRDVLKSFNWPQDLNGVTHVVELYVVNDYSQVKHLVIDFIELSPYLYVGAHKKAAVH